MRLILGLKTYALAAVRSLLVADFIAEVGWKCRPGRRWSFSLFLSTSCRTLPLPQQGSANSGSRHHKLH